MGLAYVAPIGVQNLFVINSAATQKRRRALITALIVIFFDVSLAFACFFGVGLLMENLTWLKKVILLIGSITVMYIGFSLLKTKVEQEESRAVESSLFNVMINACVVTWFNPQAIIDGTMMLGAFKATLEREEAMHFIFGVTSASFAWFLGVSLVVSWFRNLFNTKVLRAINLICGAVILFYGVKLFWSFVYLIRG